MGKLNLSFIIRKRKEYGLSLQEMALMLGFKNASTYLKYENGCYSFVRKKKKPPALQCKRFHEKYIVVRL